MTRREQIAYWKKYARRNAHYERVGVGLFEQAIIEAINPVARYIAVHGYSESVLDQRFDTAQIRSAYEAFYTYVGINHRDWTEREMGVRLKAWAPQLQTKDRTRQQIEEESAKNPSWGSRLRNLIGGIDIAQRLTSVTETVKKKARQVLDQARKLDLSPRRMARFLREEMAPFARRRAEVISRTETTFAANIAAEQAATEYSMRTGLQLMKRWIPTLDDRTRDAHRAMAGKPAILRFEKFVVGGLRMDKPGDPAGGIGNTARCRCVVVYFVKEDQN